MLCEYFIYYIVLSHKCYYFMILFLHLKRDNEAYLFLVRIKDHVFELITTELCWNLNFDALTK